VAAAVVLVWVVKWGKFAGREMRVVCGVIMEPPPLHYVSTQPAKLRLWRRFGRFVKAAW